MDDQSMQLQKFIIGFMAVINQCLEETTFANDRSLYEKDLAHASEWLIKLNDGSSASDIAKEIADPITSKFFTDHWKQGAWGEREALAITNLQHKAKSFL